MPPHSAFPFEPPPHHTSTQVQLAVPSGYARNGVAAARNFTFHACLGPASRQQDVLRLCGITQLLDAALDGYNATVMAYGQTGSGKTFTMSGAAAGVGWEGSVGLLGMVERVGGGGWGWG